MASARAISTRRLSTWGEGGGELLDRAGIADEGKQPLDRVTRLGCVRRPTREGRPERAEASPADRDLEVLADRQVPEELGGLVGAGDAGPRDGLGRLPGHLPVPEPYRARLRSQVAADEVENGGLPGPIRPDDARHRAGLGPERNLVHRDYPAKGNREPLHRERLGGPGAGEESGDVELAGPCGTLVDTPEPPLDLPHDSAGGRHQDDEEQHPDEEQSVLGEGGEELRQQHHDKGADDRPDDGADSADDGDEEEEDRLEEGKRFGADELREGSEDRPRDAGDRGRQGECGGPDHHRIEAE